jgi:hypothetical protein
VGIEIFLGANWGFLLDRARVPDLSVRWIISTGGEGDSRDPTMNELVVAP